MPTASKNFARWALLAAVLLAPAALLAAAATSGPAPLRRGILAHGDGETIWLAAISGRSAEPPLTGIYVRRKFGEENWLELPAIPARIAALTSHTGESLLLLDPISGRRREWAWYSPDPLRMSYGPPLPRNSTVLVMAGDRQRLWALGRPEPLPGGAATRSATTRRAAATTPSTRPARRALPILCQLQGTGWVERRAPWPADLASYDDAGLSMAIVGDTPVLAVAMPDGRIHVMHWEKEQWVRAEKPLHLPVPPRYLKTLNVGNRVALWIQPDDDWEPIGSVWTAAGGFAKLALTGPTPRAGEMDLTWVGEQFRLLFRHNNQLFEQRYDASGNPSGQAIELKILRTKPSAEMDNWTTIAIMAVVAILALNVLLRRRAADQEDDRNRDSE